LQDASIIAGRMAHDFDNILTGIIGFSDLTIPMLQPGSQAARFVAEIGKVGHRGTVFTQQLHQLSRSGQVKPSPASVVAALAKEELRVRTQAPGVRFERELPPALPAVSLECGPLQTVLGHLLENAAEACPQGGLVRVAALPVELTEADARGYLGRPSAGAHVLVTLTDTGIGIKPEVRRRLFVEPFFTTKVRHRGLGLAIAYRILCAHRGGIQIDSVPPPGSGTQVRVVLPLSPVRPPAATGNPAGHAATVGGMSTTAVGG
jgi:signal transduction histidine kinase